MNLIRELKPDTFGMEGVVDTLLFATEVGVFIEEGASVDYAQKCADYFNSLPDHVIASLCAAAIRYCNEALDAVGEPLMEFRSDRDVLNIVYPSVLMVPPGNHESAPVIHMELNCDWEEEHGMEWIIRDDEVLYVGQFTGENPLGDFSEKKSWNHA
ncbi:MAG: hypothetical protein QGG36_15380 [Pirellulaceae bacterium]|nr:hypothetical protein [Pirellulaceae bacterium]